MQRIVALQQSGGAHDGSGRDVQRISRRMRTLLCRIVVDVKTALDRDRVQDRVMRPQGSRRERRAARDDADEQQGRDEDDARHAVAGTRGRRRS